MSGRQNEAPVVMRRNVTSSDRLAPGHLQGYTVTAEHRRLIDGMSPPSISVSRFQISTKRAWISFVLLLERAWISFVLFTTVSGHESFWRSGYRALTKHSAAPEMVMAVCTKSKTSGHRDGGRPAGSTPPKPSISAHTIRHIVISVAAALRLDS